MSDLKEKMANVFSNFADDFATSKSIENMDVTEYYTDILQAVYEDMKAFLDIHQCGGDMARACFCKDTLKLWAKENGLEIKE